MSVRADPRALDSRRAQGDDFVFHSGIVTAENSPEHAGGTEPADERDNGLPYQRCRWCRSTMFRSAYCPACASTDLETELSEGTGTVRRSRIVQRKTAAERNTVVVEMAEGFSVRGQVIDAPFAVPTGSRVRLTDAVGAYPGELVFELSRASGAWTIPWGGH
jgi:hypothetical protein